MVNRIAYEHDPCNGISGSSRPTRCVSIDADGRVVTRIDSVRQTGNRMPSARRATCHRVELYGADVRCGACHASARHCSARTTCVPRRVKCHARARRRLRPRSDSTRNMSHALHGQDTGRFCEGRSPRISGDPAWKVTLQAEFRAVCRRGSRGSLCGDASLWWASSEVPIGKWRLRESAEERYGDDALIVRPGGPASPIWLCGSRD